jgi:hypothetical protein
MDWATLYALLTGLVLGIALMSRSRIVIMLAALMLLDWSITMAAQTLAGMQRAPIYIATGDAGVTLLVAWVAGVTKIRGALDVFGIFALGAIWHVACFMTHHQGIYGYYLVLNVLYAWALFVIGTEGVKQGMAFRPRRGGYRFAADHPRGYRTVEKSRGSR